MSFNIDVHIIHLPDENKDWWNKCEASLSDQPINLFHVDGVVGNVGAGRQKGYSQGSAEYVSFVDPDDIVMPGAYAKLLESITEDHCGCYSISEVIRDDKIVGLLHPFRPWSKQLMLRSFTEVHQLTIIRRDLIERMYRDFEHIFSAHNHSLYEILTYTCLATYKPWRAINYIGYQWRKHANGNHVTIKNPQLIGQLMKEILQ